MQGGVNGLLLAALEHPNNVTYLFCDVKCVTVRLRVKPTAAKCLSKNRVVWLFNSLKKRKQQKPAINLQVNFTDTATKHCSNFLPYVRSSQLQESKRKNLLHISSCANLFTQAMNSSAIHPA